MKKISGFILLIILMLIISSCQDVSEYNLFYRFENDEYIDINLYQKGDESNAIDIITAIDYWNIMLDHENVNDTNDNLAALNVNKFARLDEKLISLIKDTIRICDEFGVVNPLYGSLKDL